MTLLDAMPEIDPPEGKQPDAPQKKSFYVPDEVHKFNLGQVRLVAIGDTVFSRRVLQPSWRWSTSRKDTKGTESCQDPHTLFFLGGRMHVRMDNGTEEEYGPGNVGKLSPGHDSWVVGDKPAVILEIIEKTHYTKQEIEEETVAVRRRADKLIAALNTQNPKEYMNFFDEKAEVTSMIGMTACGLPSVQQYLEQILRSSLPDDRFLRIISDRIHIFWEGIAHAAIYWDINKSTDPQPPRVSYMTGITNLFLVKQNDWFVRIMQSMDLTKTAK